MISGAVPDRSMVFRQDTQRPGLLSRSLLDSGGNLTVSSLGDPQVNADGSVDLYFGPTPPKAGTKNWIKTDPDKGFFVVFRFYGPLEGYIDKTWVLDDFELIQ